MAAATFEATDELAGLVAEALASADERALEGASSIETARPLAPASDWREVRVSGVKVAASGEGDRWVLL